MCGANCWTDHLLVYQQTQHRNSACSDRTPEIAIIFQSTTRLTVSIALVISTKVMKDKFYDDLDSVISVTPHTEMSFLLGNLNARAGTDNQAWKE